MHESPRGGALAGTALLVSAGAAGTLADSLFVTAANDAWNEPYPGQVFKIENR